jgi:transcriptional antiterminator RfaH
MMCREFRARQQRSQVVLMPILVQETCVYPDDLLCESPAELAVGDMIAADVDSSDSVAVDSVSNSRAWDDVDRQWWAVYTKSRQEKALARQLVGHRVPFYLPLIPKDSIIRGRRVRSLLPLFSGYLFLYGSEQERVTTLTTNRISRILPVLDQDRLRRELVYVHTLIGSNAPLSLETRLMAGDRVRISTGSLRGLEGVVVKRHGKIRLLVAVTYLQQGVSVEIDDCALERL